MGNIIVGIIVLVVFGLALYFSIKGKASHCSSCNGGCSSGSCGCNKKEE